MKNEDLAFIETDYSCAYCGQKGMENLTIDHIEGKNGDHANKYDNLIVLCHNCHHRKTNDKGITRDVISKIKKSLIQKTLTIFGVNLLKKLGRGYKDSKGDKNNIFAEDYFVEHLLNMGFIKKDPRKFQNSTNSGGRVSFYWITEDGMRIYNKWFSRN